MVKILSLRQCFLNAGLQSIFMPVFTLISLSLVLLKSVSGDFGGGEAI